MKRRTFLKAGLAGSLVALSPLKSLWANPSKASWLSGVRLQDGRFGVVKLKEDLSYDLLFKTGLRLHGINISKDHQWVVAPARRPGNLLWIHNLPSNQTKVVSANEGFHFFGHGVFSPDGKYFITAQNNFEKEKGAIVIHDVMDGFKTIATYDSFGIGPHEIALCPKTNQLIVANGGILTHPETGRAKLNLDTMEPNLCRMDFKSGKLLDQVKLSEDNHQLSLRHLCVDQNGTIYVGAQDQAGIRADKPLVWKWKIAQSNLSAMKAPEMGWGRFRGYIGSLAINQNEATLAVTSPRGHVVSLWDLSTETHPELIKMNDVCGLAAEQVSNQFIATTGEGIVRRLSPNGKVDGFDQTQHPLSFDNHSLLVF